MIGLLKATVWGAVMIAAALVLMVETVCWMKGTGWREPLYWGGIAGYAISLLGLPFLLKLAVVSAEAIREGAVWGWWLGGMMARLMGLFWLSNAMKGRFVGYGNEVTFVAMAVYMAGLGAELAWLAKRFNAMDKR